MVAEFAEDWEKRPKSHVSLENFSLDSRAPAAAAAGKIDHSDNKSIKKPSDSQSGSCLRSS